MATDIKMTMNLSCGRIGVRATQEQAVEWAHYYGFRSVDPDPRYLARLNDVPKGLDRLEMADTTRELPGATGVIDVAAFMTALKDIGYDGPVRAEPFNETLNKMADDEAIAVVYRAMEKLWDYLQ